jgi:hypothetical protein
VSVIARIRKTITDRTPHDVLRDAVIADPDGAAHWIADLHADAANYAGAVSEARTQAIRDVILMLRDSGIGRDARVADHIERHMLGGQS